MLHQAFDKKRVNLVNSRKKFFRVTLKEIEALVKEKFSKQRIYVSKRREDFLYDVSLSAAAMDKINEKLKERYIYQ